MKKRIEQAQKYLKWQKPNQAIAELRPLLRNHNSTPENAWIPNHMMGIALSQKAEHQSSAKYFKKAIKEGSVESETYHMLSVNYYNLGQFEKAEQYGKEAVERKGDFLKAWLNLGSVYRSQAKLDEALKCYQKANQLDPKNAGVAFRIGEIYRDQGDLEQALKLFDITLKIDKDHKHAILEKAEAYKKQGNYEKALRCIEEAKERHGIQTPIQVSEAELYKSKGDYDKAIDVYEQLLEKEPDNGILRVNYALCLQEVSRFGESEKNYRLAIEGMADNMSAISNYLMGLHYNPKNSKEEIFEEHVRLGKEFQPRNTRGAVVPSDTTRNKQLKIGFVSGGFRRHPVGWMIAGALEQLPSDHFELYCYTTNNQYDFVTRRIHQNIDVWRSVVGYNSDVIESLIREDDLDILVDLSGHSADNCLEVMAREPAPIIVKWVGGLFNTTGLEAFDYLISDWHESPEGEEPYYTEKLVRLPDDYVTFTPPAYAPEVGELPAKKNGYITFGCFNNPTKVNEAVLKQWAKIMQEVSGSRLFLKSKQYDTPSFRDQITEIMKEHGISGDRIEFQGHTPHDVHLDAYNSIDIALDPWPYSGGLTTCEALYMGVPVITLPGPTFAGRHSATHLINAGLSKWVTCNWEEYTEKVVALTKDRDTLQTMRERLREQILDSPVCDGKRFGAHLSVAFQKMWEQWIDGYENDVKEWQDHIEVKSLSQEEIETLTDGPDTTPLITIKEDNDLDSIIEEEVNNFQPEDIQQPIATEKMTTQVSVNGQHAASKRDVQQQDKTYYIETKDNLTICTPADLDLLTPYVLLEQEEWFEPELDFMRQYLQPGMQVVDVGASFGAYALPMAKKVEGKGSVYAFEPGAVASRYLQMSKSENGFNQLEVIERGLGQEIEKARLKKAESPEFNTIDKDGEEEVSVTTLDAWWAFAGQPDIDLVKIDVNGMEPEVLQGATKILGAADPVILASIGEKEESLAVLREQLTEMDYVLFEYIPGPGLFAEHEPGAGVDPYLMNIVAIPSSRVEEFKKHGWIFDERATPEKPENTLWKKTLSALPWTASLMDDWEEEIASGAHEEYLQALNMICAAERMDVRAGDAESRSRKGATMLAAAQKLVGLFNSGNAGISAAMTYVRVMNQLGKRTQAVEMMKELMETVNSGQDISIDLPFLLPLPMQDNTDIQTDFPKWLTVRIVEAWIMLKAPSTYMSGEQEKQMLKALEGNPEVLPVVNKITGDVLELNKPDNVKEDKKKHSGTFIHLCFNHVYAKSLSDLLKYTNDKSDQEHWLFLEQRRAIPSYSADISDNPHTTFFDRETQLQEVLHECLKQKVDGVFVHGLFFDWQKKIINEVGDHKHIAWKYWGGDLYNPIKQGFPLNDLISKVNSIHGKVEGDFEIIKEMYGEKQEYRFGYTFPGLYGDWPEEIEKETPPIITVGNSGDQSNNHIEILEILAEKKDIKDYQLHLPVAYNLSRSYRDELVRSIKNLDLANNTRLQESFIPPREYMQMIMRGRMLIVAHNRQQALGNILASIYSGNNTFVKKKVFLEGEEIVNPTWRFIEDHNLKVQPFVDLRSVDYLSEIPAINKDVKKKHQKLIQAQVGLDARSQPLVEACDQIAKENKNVML